MRWFEVYEETLERLLHIRFKPVSLKVSVHVSPHPERVVGLAPAQCASIMRSCSLHTSKSSIMCMIERDSRAKGAQNKTLRHRADLNDEIDHYLVDGHPYISERWVIQQLPCQLIHVYDCTAYIDVPFSFKYVPIELWPNDSSGFEPKKAQVGWTCASKVSRNAFLDMHERVLVERKLVDKGSLKMPWHRIDWYTGVRRETHAIAYPYKGSWRLLIRKGKGGSVERRTLTATQYRTWVDEHTY